MQVVVWSKDHCPYCDQAKALLGLHNIEFNENKIGYGFTREDLLEAVPTARTVPQIVINGISIGGFTELRKYIEENKLTGTDNTL